MKTYDFKVKAILRALSENARCSVSDLAKTAKCSRITATKTLKKLVNDYGIRFGIEVDEDAVGLFQRHLIIVKLQKRPKQSDLEKIFKDDPYVDNVYLCEGDFNLIIHAVTSDPMKYIVWESLLAGKLGAYGANIYPSELMRANFGNFPVSGRIISRFATNLDDVDKRLITSLAEDSGKSISAISKELKINRATVYYRLFTLEKRGVIKRFTVSVNKPPFGYIMAYAVNYRFNKTSSSRSIKMMEYYKAFDEQAPILNTFQLLAPMSGSFRFLGICLFDDRPSAITGAIEAHKSIFYQEHVDIKHARITGIIKGSYPFRSLDMINNYTRFRWSEDDLR